MDGLYLTDVEGYGGPNVSSGIQVSSSANDTPVFFVCNHCVMDSINGPAYQFSNVTDVSLADSWGSMYKYYSGSQGVLSFSGGGDSVFRGNNFYTPQGGGPDVVLLGAPYRLTFARNLYSSTASMFDIDAGNPPTGLSILGDRPGASFAVPLIGSSKLSAFIGALADASDNQSYSGGLTVLTKGAGSNDAQTLALRGDSGNAVRFRVDPAGGLDVLNNTFGTAFGVGDDGTLRLFNVETSGGASASLGSNSPAASPGAPWTWIRTTIDGNTVYIPAWR